MAYRCDQAIFGGAREPIRCRVSGSVCAHQKMCLMEGRIVLTDGAMRCPARDGQLPEEVPVPEVTVVERIPDADAAKVRGNEPNVRWNETVKAPAKTTAARKKSESTKAKKPATGGKTSAKTAKAPAKKTGSGKAG